MRVRVKFRKYGPIRFIGHLDVMRYFQKALRRAEIDVAYTAGFSPHQIMSFASPLGVGLESNGEYMDIECHSVTDSRDMMERLNRVGAPGIEVVSVKLLPKNAGNAMASVAAAAYTVRFREGRAPRFDYASKLDEFLSMEHIYVQKETKKGLQEVDIRPGIFEMSIVANDCCEESPAIYLLADSSSAGNVKPAKVVEAYCGAFGTPLADNALLITREETYTELREEEETVAVSSDVVKVVSAHAEGTIWQRRLVPLDEMGTEILTPMDGAVLPTAQEAGKAVLSPMPEAAEREVVS